MLSSLVEPLRYLKLMAASKPTVSLVNALGTFGYFSMFLGFMNCLALFRSRLRTL